MADTRKKITLETFKHVPWWTWIFIVVCAAIPVSTLGGAIPTVIAILGIVTILIGGGISLLASSSPDGLEWSMENVAGSTELDSKGSAYDKASEIQEKTAILPDYSISNSNNEILGTSFSGILGSVLVAVILIGGSLIFRFYKKGAKNEQTRKSA